MADESQKWRDVSVTAVPRHFEPVLSAVSRGWTNNIDHVILVNVVAIVIFALAVVFFVSVFFVISNFVKR